MELDFHCVLKYLRSVDPYEFVLAAQELKKAMLIVRFIVKEPR